VKKQQRKFRCRS